MATYVKCGMNDCFQNKCGVRCELLSDYVSSPCPFYKTEEEVEAGRIKAHNRLLLNHREDLIEKYEYNPMRGRNW